MRRFALAAIVVVLPGVTVTIPEVHTNISYSTSTNESGHYVFSNLKDSAFLAATFGQITSTIAGSERSMWLASD